MEKKKKALLPGYYSSINEQKGKQRYSEKLKLVSGLDPYEVARDEWKDDVELWPAISHIHIGMYLLLNPSPYSKDDLLNYKSMDCYINFLSGWVREVLAKEIDNKRIMIAKVNHSQRMNEKPLVPWVVAEKDGRIIAAHCNCMAGMGESCSHIASLLWAVEAGVRVRDAMTPTEKKAYWVIPSVVKDVPYAPVKDINFEGKKKSLKHMASILSSVSSSVGTSESTSLLLPTTEGSAQSSDSLDLDVPSTSITDAGPADIETQPTTVDDPNQPADTELVVATQAAHQPIMSASLDQVEDLPTSDATIDVDTLNDTIHYSSETKSSEKSESEVSMPSNDELSGLFHSLASCPGKPAILALVEQHCEDYVPKSLNDSLPKSLLDLHKPEYLDLNYSELVALASQYTLAVSSEEASTTEAETRRQCRSRLWFRMRAGRITASRFKAVCSTSIASPSLSLILSICHPGTVKFRNVAADWGCEHEEAARNLYKFIQLLCHRDFELSDCGFFINTDHPFIGASPDGLVKCTYCGEGICEIKCPYCHKETDVADAVEDSKFCLEKGASGKYQLKCTHAYFYQVQCQLFCAKRSYCDFIVWTTKDVHIERIYPDKEFWSNNLAKAKSFFTRACLPELFGRFYSRPPKSDLDEATDDTDEDVAQYCYCRGPEEGDMVGCDRADCKYRWFHLKCLKLDSFPKTQHWYCPDCRIRQHK